MEFENQISNADLVLIINESLSKEEIDYLEKIETKNEGIIKCLVFDKMVSKLKTLLISDLLLHKFNPKKTLLVYPGNGGKDIMDKLDLSYIHPSTNVPAKRLWQPGQDPVVCTWEVLPERHILTNIETVVVIDDVISSGKTIEQLYVRNIWKFPKAKWHALSLVGRPKKINGYDYLYTLNLITNSKCPEKKIPINSISTFIEDKKICVDYALRNIKNPNIFIDFFDFFKDH